MAESMITELEAVIHARRTNPHPESYTNTLLDDPEEAVKKVGEEAVEVILAALQQSPARLASETADLIYHLLVVLALREVSWQEVEVELRRRREQ